MSTSLVVLQKMSNGMWYYIVINSHIAFNYIHIKFWVVNDAMVLGMKTNLLIWLLICSYRWLRNLQQVEPNYLWCLQIVGFFLKKKRKEKRSKCMKAVHPS